MRERICMCMCEGERERDRKKDSGWVQSEWRKKERSTSYFMCMCSVRFVNTSFTLIKHLKVFSNLCPPTPSSV